MKNLMNASEKLNEDFANLLHILTHALLEKDIPQRHAMICTALVDYMPVTTLALFILFGSLRPQTKCILEYEKVLDIISENASPRCADIVRADIERFASLMEESGNTCH